MAEQLAPTEILAPTPEPIVTEELEPTSTIATDDPKHGWSPVNAQWNAERLRDFLGSSLYSYCVVPTRCPGRYGFIIQELRTGSAWGKFFTQDQVTQRWQHLAKRPTCTGSIMSLTP